MARVWAAPGPLTTRLLRWFTAVALIRAAQPNICVYGHGGRLRLQVGPEQFALSENSPRIKCTRGVASFGLRRRFTVESSTGGVLFCHAYWTNHQGEDFFRWLAARAQDPDWRTATGRRWTEGVSAARAALDLIPRRASDRRLPAPTGSAIRPSRRSPRSMLMMRTRRSRSTR